MKKCLLVLMGAFHADGGIPSVNRLMIQAIAEDGYALDIFCLIEDDRTINTAYLLETTSVRYSVFHRDKYAFTLSVWRALLTETYDYVLVDHINLASMLAPLSKLKRCSYIVWLHGSVGPQE